MAHIICDADPFCYGPAATLLSVARILATFGHQLTVLANGTAAELAQREPAVRTIICDTSSEKALSAVLQRLGGADLLMTVLGDASVRVAQAYGVPVAYIDPLFWVWPSCSEPHIAKAELYFVEQHFGAAARLGECPAGIHNLILVPPIIEISESERGKRRKGVFVAYGGVDSHMTESGKDGNYPMVLTRLLIEALNQVGLEELGGVTVTGGQRAMIQLRQAFAIPSVAFVSLAHSQYVQQLAASKLLLGIPGIGTPLEGFTYGVPVAFLPPLNYSQVLQLRRFRSAGVAPLSLSWDDLDPEAPIHGDLLEEQGVAEVLSRVRRLEIDVSWQTSVKAWLVEVLSQAETTLERVQQSQFAYISSLGTSGARQVAGAINKFVAG